MKKTKVPFLLIIICSLYSVICDGQWVQVSNGMGNITVWSLAVNVNNIFAGTIYGIYLSSNNGTTWSQTSLNNQDIISFAINGNYFFAGSGDGYGVYLSTNNGTNWAQTSLDSQVIYALATNGSNVFAGTEQRGIYMSTNNGTNWTQIPFNNQTFRALASNMNTVFAGAFGNGIYISTNNGTNWTWTLQLVHVFSFAVNGNNVFAGTEEGGVYLSTNNGVNWTQTSLNNQFVLSLVVNGNNIFAGTHAYGVFVSNNSGASWTQRNEGLVINDVFSLCILENYIFAGTSGSSVYRRPLAELVGIKPISEQLPVHYTLKQNYPNPFNPTTNIRFSLPMSSFTKLVIYDIVGSVVETLVSEMLNFGTYEIEWDASNYPSGVYYYKLSAGNYIQTKKMVLLK